MKKTLRKGLVIITIYFIAVICTFIVTNRVEELDSSNTLRNENKSLSINFTK